MEVSVSSDNPQERLWDPYLIRRKDAVGGHLSLENSDDNSAQVFKRELRSMFVVTL
jgi:hypothetical protein